MTEANSEQKSTYDGIDFNELFYEVLSGEFSPLQDTSRRTHTLGKLAYTTALNSVATINEVKAGVFLHEHVCTPSWAPGFEVTSAGIVTDNRLSIDTIFLNTKDSGDELVITGLKEDRVSIEDLKAKDPTPSRSSHELSLASIDRTRITITLAAQTFFDRNYRGQL